MAEKNGGGILSERNFNLAEYAYMELCLSNTSQESYVGERNEKNSSITLSNHGTVYGVFLWE